MTPAVIPSGSKILLDSMTVIYFLEQHEQYGELARQVFQRIESGDKNFNHLANEGLSIWLFDQLI